MKTAGWIMIIIGFVIYIMCLDLVGDISGEAWLYAFFASIGAVLFTNGLYLR